MQFGPLRFRLRLSCLFFFFSSRRRHTRFDCDWSSDVCSSDLRKLLNEARRDRNRNIAIYGNLIIDTSMDNYVYALDAQTGKLAWETQILDPKKPANASSGPIIANGKIIAGRQCQPGATYEGCIMTAHDAKTGKELWRTSTIPN